ncbi:MAG: ATP-dependent helicase, partial [Bacteroidales bacterium]|nr:ATP-dependent helicase [Bacteroidales bacterium]
VEDIAEKGGQLLGEAIKRMRNRQVFIKEGYDGEYGIIKVFNENELKINAAQSTLFSYEIIEKTETPEPRKLLNFNLKEYQEISKGIDFQDLPVSEPLKVKEEPAIYGLNNEQIKAVKHYKNPALVIAGPGTGKTRVLTYRICHLVENFNIPPDNILAVTFTNKASAEIKERILKTSVKSLAGKITIGTFHSLGLRIISEYCSLLNRKADFIIIDENDKIQVLKKIGYTNNYKQIIECISKEKQSLSLINSIEDDYLRQAFINYDENLYKSNAFDFDDLIYQAYRLLKMNNNILEKVRQKYRFIIIDEFQDINYAQFELIKLLLGNENNLMAIGDPNQAIYGFRGANNEYINNFKTTFSNSHVYTLNTSYRCTNNILKASHNILPKNETIQLIGQKTGDKVIIQQNLTEKSEAECIARKIEKMIGGLRHFSMDSQIADGNEDFNISGLSQFAVLGRTKSVLQPFEKAFNDHSIPYQLIGDEKLTERPEIKDLISVFKYIESKNPIYINPDLKTFVIKHTDVFQTLNIRGQVEFILNNIHPDFSKINETQYKLLVKFSENCANSGELIRNISLSNEADLFNSGEKVSLMTIHASKGLEFECVFIAGCEEGIIPYSLFPEYKSNIDEESRLLYVGMTRAKNYLYLCHSEKRFYSGREMQLNRSGFINRIDESIISYDQSIQYKRNKQGYQLSLFD